MQVMVEGYKKRFKKFSIQSTALFEGLKPRIVGTSI